MEKSVYLAGPIFDCDDYTVHRWRNDAAAALSPRGWKVVNPATMDFRGQERKAAKEIVRHDMKLMESCEFMLANCGRVSAGTSMEIFHFFTRGLGRVVSVSRNPSPWVTAHSHYVSGDVDEAIGMLMQWMP